MKKNKTFTWRTHALREETPDAMTILFDTGGEDFDYKPGQFINIEHELDGKKIARSYSLSSSPAYELPAITVKKTINGVFSNHLFRHACQVNEWSISGPHGNFFADPLTIKEKPVVLIGGGSGVTPLFSIIKTLLGQPGAPLYFVNCNRSRADSIFADHLQMLEEQYPERFRVAYYFSREMPRQEPEGKNYRNERISRLLLKKELKKWLGEKLREAAYFICGPTALIQLSIEALETMGIPAAQIHTEYFIPPADQAPVVPQTAHHVVVDLTGQRRLIKVQPGQSILDAGLQQEVPLTYSCKAGNCGRCAVRKTGGQVYMKINYALSPTEVEDGYILLCQSSPLDDEVVVVAGARQEFYE